MADNRVTRANTPAHLQGFSIGYKPRGLIADQVCPRITVGKQSGKYRVWGKDIYYLRDGRRAPGAPPNEMRVSYASDVYACEDFALRHPLLDEERTNADADLRLEARYTEAATLAVALMREKRVSDLFTTAGNFATTHKKAIGASSEWDTLLSSAPQNVLNDINVGIQTVSDDASIPASMLSIVMPEQVFRKAVLNNSAYLDRVKYAAMGIVTEQLMATVHGVKEIILSSAQGIAMPEKVVADLAADLAPSALWGDSVWIGVIGQPESEMEPAFARSFNWTAGSNGQTREVRTYRAADEGERKDWIEVAEWMDEKITGSLGGYLITNTLG